MSSVAIPTKWREQIAAFAAVGVRHMQLNFLDFPRTDSLDLFLARRAPAFHSAGT